LSLRPGTWRRSKVWSLALASFMDLALHLVFDFLFEFVGQIAKAHPDVREDEINSLLVARVIEIRADDGCANGVNPVIDLL
jgi:hypothetical protein